MKNSKNERNYMTMKKTKKVLYTLLSALLAVCIMISCAVATFAADFESKEISQMRNEVYYDCVLDFYITSTGNAVCSVDYSADSSTFTYATCTIKIQKQVFLFIWSDVEVNANKKWEDYSTSNPETFYHTHQLESTGNYRAVFTVDIYGTGGLHDTISDTIERTY